jgi:voltage-gated potassium channel
MADRADLKRTINLLGAVPLFSSLNERQLKTIVQAGKERTIPAGERIVRQGEKGIGMFLILDGQVAVEKSGTKVASLSSGQFFGEMALLEEQARTADVRASTPVRCLVLSRWEFWGSVSKEPEVIRMLFAETVRRLRSAGPGLSE